jgi:dolichol-phosphate mannosyltransferase
MKISSTQEVEVIVPIFNNEHTLRNLTSRLLGAFAGKVRILFIDDGSQDSSLLILVELAKTHPEVKVWTSKRNLGQQSAIRFGLLQTECKFVAVMDADLQDRPEDLVSLLSSLRETEDQTVFAKDVDRGSGVLKNKSSRLFSEGFRKINGWGVESGAGNFCVMTDRMVQHLSSLPGQDFFLPYEIVQSGLPYSSIQVQRDTRTQGKSSYSTKKRLKLALNIFVWNSNRLLQASLFFIIVVLSGIIAITILMISNYASGRVGVDGWTSTNLLILAVGASVLISNWVLGLYIGKILENLSKVPTSLRYYSPRIDSKILRASKRG